MAARSFSADHVTTGDVDEVDNLEEQVAMFARLLTVATVTILSFLGGLLSWFWG